MDVSAEIWQALTTSEDPTHQENSLPQDNDSQRLPMTAWLTSLTTLSGTLSQHSKNIPISRRGVKLSNDGNNVFPVDHIFSTMEQLLSQLSMSNQYVSSTVVDGTQSPPQDLPDASLQLLVLSCRIGVLEIIEKIVYQVESWLNDRKSSRPSIDVHLPRLSTESALGSSPTFQISMILDFCEQMLTRLRTALSWQEHAESTVAGKMIESASGEMDHWDMRVAPLHDVSLCALRAARNHEDSTNRTLARVRRILQTTAPR
ncbi:hypothetical protein AMS68_002424 [Peltaster fructicola]|uniref:Aflatoxin regulatory protein domain-containing protein n=1 Tax=Peltaster fructicola TaxID=286661 RepID=A0A6H0XQ76_9PEZI|nr:hypothetical protein AMS68_002424 [Peltaster fructicola]